MRGWRAAQPWPPLLRRAVLTGRGTGSRIPTAFTISTPDEPGDGTVPARSGLAVRSHCEGFLRVPVEHEPAYNPKAGEASVKALHFTLRAIVRLVQQVRQSDYMMYEDLR